MPRSRKKSESEQYHVTVDLGSEKMTFWGDTVKSCLDKIGKRLVKGAGKIYVRKGDLRSQVYLQPGRLRKMMANDLFRAILDKQLNQLLT